MTGFPGGSQARLWLFGAPAFAFVTAFLLLPLVRLAWTVGETRDGFATYLLVLVDARYLTTFATTLLLAAATTAATLGICLVCGLFLERNRFRGRSVLLAVMTLPLSFPGVVVGFLVIILAGRRGLIGELSLALSGDRLVFAYSIGGLFLGYLYFSIPRVLLTIMAAAEKLDRSLEEAARSLGAGRWRVVRDVLLPGLAPAMISAGAICFATAMGAFGTAFTLATRIDVVPMVIYTEFTLHADVGTAAALSIFLGLITWACLLLARSAAGTGGAAAGTATAESTP